MEAHHSKQKYESMTELAAEVGVGLRNIKSPEAQDLYGRLQAVETMVVTAGAAYDRATEALAKRRGASDAARRSIRALVDGCIAVGQFAGVPGVDAFTAFDRGDYVALAGRLESAFKGRGGLAAELTKLLVNARRELQVGQVRLEKGIADHVSSTRALAAEVFKLQGLIAAGRALLIANGVRVSRRKPKRVTKQGSGRAARQSPGYPSAQDAAPPASIHLVPTGDPAAAIG